MAEQVRRTAGDSKWFTEARFGMFIHWGLYAMGARHEWLQHNEQIPVPEYERRYFKHFNPDLYDPEMWAKTAANAGMKYFVITTKHHEGFCLWDSEYTDYKAPSTPCGKDLLKPMVDAYRNNGLRVGLYHSLIDWHHPQYTIDPHVGPYRNADRDKMNKTRNQAKYAEYLHNQVRELLTKFGKIDIMWFDFSYPKPDGSGKGRNEWQSEKLYKMVRELMPGVMLDDRLDLEKGWDIKTPEQFQPREWVTVNGQKVVWEACQTFSGSWGYHRDESSWRSVDELIRTLIDCVSKGGNLLLNVGPTARGEFDYRAIARLEGIGEWMRRHGRSIYGCTQAPAEFNVPENCKLTYNPAARRLYVHILAWPYRHLYLDGNAFADRVEYAQLLNDASEIGLGLEPWVADQMARKKIGKRQERSVVLQLPADKPSVTVPVVELFLKR
ncbi:alpha-L-fucosidase [Candidatus Desantisbacteria bacterium CG_4_10_14_0_8_um_filter_48_22]|uniref:alpha-L-fucosidase n=1 Tax=Candidatus Desantisbacteria bacterium CG_4_10_14_0_8_um_filter_48_22 TaxID=1974543 RepID=A0A2M7S5A0_9BACT|nr:MAG: alpha-L-fucosidase [Candidatus Desantisbacteria bacterium CG1_02_49_89]PIV56507.1 MAG: alpha-L-fucosidase [Candidatus Desantisbacteria bacterium CG02_land_8_20_14_3_00_49_13]PIZ14736.1 MAG: alpha-L-fucosidase [Candidatus Desantisbacteria bacterium CG_4_10_14_0_8_um_filter_48_22]